MKSEHRHDLQTNELGKFAEKAAVYIDKHGNRLMLGICATAIVLSAGIYFWRMESSKRVSAWTDLSSGLTLSNGKPEVLKAVWDDHPGTVPGLWAKVYEGEGWLGQGVQASFRNLEKASEDLKKARDAFQLVVDQKGVPKEIRERALFGLGRALESLSDGNSSDAVKAYTKLVEEFPDSEYKTDAQSRISILNSGRGQEFYAWFSKYTRPKIADKLPRDFGSSGLDDDGMLNELIEKDGKKDQGSGKDPTKLSSDEDEDLSLGDGEKKPAQDAEPATASEGNDPPATPDKKPESAPQGESGAQPEPESSPAGEAKPE